MKNIIVTEKTLKLYFKYKCDFSLLDEPWASSKDKKILSEEEIRILGGYVDLLYFYKADRLSEEIKTKTKSKLDKLEVFIEDSVIETLKHKILL